jgi:hypothetical protein
MDRNDEKLSAKEEVCQIVGPAIDRITDHERRLTLNYLRITKLRAGVVLNFKHAKLEWERIVSKLVFIGVHSWLAILAVRISSSPECNRSGL